MRRHDNQIAPLPFSGRDDTFGRMLILHVDDIAGHAVCVPTLDSAIEDAIGRRCRHLFKMTNWIRPMLPRLVGHLQGRPWLRHRDNGDVCIVMLGEGKTVFKSLRRQFRAVGCNQDMLVHRWTSSALPIHYARRLPWHSRAVGSRDSTIQLALKPRSRFLSIEAYMASRPCQNSPARQGCSDAH